MQLNRPGRSFIVVKSGHIPAEVEYGRCNVHDSRFSSNIVEVKNDSNIGAITEEHVSRMPVAVHDRGRPFRPSQRVDALGGGEVGYLRLPDMERTGFSEFWRHFPDEVRKGALVVDLRGNVGGHISELLLAKLAQRPLAWDVPRRGTSLFVFPYAQVD